MATLFGTSSPNTRVKYDNISVITMTEIVFNVEAGMLRPVSMRKSVSLLAKLSAAKALPKNPARVIPTWIIDRNCDGCSVSLLSFMARLSPSAAIFAILLSFIEMTAISAEANTALTEISITCKISGPNMEPSSNKVKTS